jgi:hypothetical protein
MFEFDRTVDRKSVHIPFTNLISVLSNTIFMDQFKARINIIGINPFVYVPGKILNGIFNQANKDKGPIPIRGTVNDIPFQQTLVRYQGKWRLYINTTMLKDSPSHIGETVNITIEYDPTDRSIKPHAKLTAALANNDEAKRAFDNLSPSIRNEIVRYISRLKSDRSVELNVARAIAYLLGKGRFIGREKVK